ncbi:hypothetical protein ACQEVS_05645 [Streptomyces sp. CA-181903]|uniref:hypothetical protein n=1 Tax=Streptomyces sp. CA-181903 TaxID=3240055 RepID=UPI003D8AA35A
MTRGLDDVRAYVVEDSAEPGCAVIADGAGFPKEDVDVRPAGAPRLCRSIDHVLHWSRRARRR